MARLKVLTAPPVARLASPASTLASGGGYDGQRVKGWCASGEGSECGKGDGVSVCKYGMCGQGWQHNCHEGAHVSTAHSEHTAIACSRSAIHTEDPGRQAGRP